jgi:hypothetical protein
MLRAVLRIGAWAFVLGIFVFFGAWAFVKFQ